MPDRRRVCVFCGSSPGSRPSYAEAARRVGVAIAEQGLGLVYGGGRIGLMGILADAALAAGGEVIGVIPEPLAIKEVAHEGLTERIVVSGMHQRKALMAEKSSGFLALPGGVGTLEEFFEIVTWAVLGLHQKPIGLLNVDGFFDPLLTMLDVTVAEGFVKPARLGMILVSDHPETIATGLLDFKPPPSGPRWIDQDQS